MRDIRTIKKGMIHAIAGIIFCMTLCIGMVCLAETPGTVTAGSAKIRASADTSSSVLASVKQNQTVDIIATTTGTDGNTWYQVWVDANTKGYIRSDLVNASGTVSATTSATTSTPAAATTTAAPAEDTSETQVSAVDAKTAYVTTNNVRIRKGASTNHGIVGTAKRGMPVTITGEATGSDSKKWYQISFNYNNQTLVGFIRSDFVTFEAIASEAAVSEITGGEESNETPEENVESENTETTEEETQQEVAEPEPQPQANSVQLMNSDDIPYIMPGFNQIILTMNDVDYNAYSNGSFYILYANYNGVEGWYLFDSSIGTYARYPYTVDATAPKAKASGVSTLPVIILIIIVVVLAGLCAFLYLKLREYVEDDDDDDENEIKPGRQAQERMARRMEERRRRSLGDLEDDDEEEEEKPKQVKPQNPKPQNGRPQGQQRPQGQRPNASNAHQRPQGQRPQPGQHAGQGQKRPASNAGVGTSQKRPQGDMARRPEQTMRKSANQSNQTRNFIETGDDGDIEFIDL